jgi:hypothetical protein
MQHIIENTDYTEEDYMRWREIYDRMPIDQCCYNAKASNLIGELDAIRYTRATDVDGVNKKVDMLVEILLRGIVFKFEGS